MTEQWYAGAGRVYEPSVLTHCKIYSKFTLRSTRTCHMSQSVICFRDNASVLTIDVKKQKRMEDWLQFCPKKRNKLAWKKDFLNLIFLYFLYHLWRNFRILKMNISGEIWILHYMHMMNQTTVKPWKTTPVPVHTAYCNFKYFKFAIQNSQIAVQNIILLCKLFFCIALLLCKIFWTKSFTVNPILVHCSDTRMTYWTAMPCQLETCMSH